MSMWKPDPEKVLKEAKWRHKEIRKIYYDRPDDGYKFRQKDWMVRRFIGDAKSAGYVLGQLIEAYDDLKKRADFMESQLAKTAGALAYEGGEALDNLGDRDFYLWLIETFGTDEDKESAGIEGEEEE